MKRIRTSSLSSTKSRKDARIPEVIILLIARFPTVRRLLELIPRMRIGFSRVIAGMSFVLCVGKPDGISKLIV